MNYHKHPKILKQVEKFGGQYSLFGKELLKTAKETSQEGKTFDEWFEEVRDHMRAFRQEINAKPYVHKTPQPRGCFVENGVEYEEYLYAGRLIVRQVSRDYDQYKG